MWSREQKRNRNEVITKTVGPRSTTCSGAAGVPVDEGAPPSPARRGPTLRRTSWETSSGESRTSIGREHFGEVNFYINTGWLWWLSTLVGLTLIFNVPPPYLVDQPVLPISPLPNQKKAAVELTVTVNPTQVIDHQLPCSFDGMVAKTSNHFENVDSCNLMNNYIFPKDSLFVMDCRVNISLKKWYISNEIWFRKLIIAWICVSVFIFYYF